MGRSSAYYGGFGLLAVALGLLLLPRWMSSAEHPLSGATSVDVCARLGDPLRTSLPEPPVQIQPGIRGQPQAGMAACTAELGAPAGDGAAPGAPGSGAIAGGNLPTAGDRYLWIAVTTQRMLAAGGGRPVSTERYTETLLGEVKASGSTVEPLKGPWRSAALVHPPLRPAEAEVLADDRGVLLWVKGVGVPDGVIVAAAEAAARELRKR